MITLNNINLSSIDLSGIDLRGIKLGLGGRGGGSGDGFPVLPGDVTRWHFGGLTNEMMAAMDDPRIEDADGKGRFLSFKNFAWGGMSGVGGYVQNFNDFINNATVDKIRIDEQSSNSVKVTILTTGVGNAIFILKSVYQFNKSYFIKISSEGYNEGDLSLSFYAPSTSTATTVKVPLNPNGITEIPAIKEDDFLAVYLNVGGKVGSITIEQLPLYPGALVFDGVDDCGTCDNFPILTKEKGYTVVALRSYLAESIGYLVYNGTNAKQSAFAFERSDSLDTWSWGKNSSIRNLLPKLMSYQTSNSYNNNIISTGTAIEGDKLIRIASVGGYCNVAIWELVFLDHDATEEELTKIKDYFVKTYPWLFPDQAWTVVGKTNEDEDRATIANITGNGNDLVLSNFGFAEGSGYGLYETNFMNWVDSHRATFTRTSSKINVTAVLKEAYATFTYSTESRLKQRIKVTGLPEGVSLILGRTNFVFYTIAQDGIYDIDVTDDSGSSSPIIGYRINKILDSCDITIEQIPEYEGYLVTDGVDDIASSNTIIYEADFTFIGEWKFIQKDDTVAGINSSSHLYIQNRYNRGATVMINSTSENKKNITDYMTFKAITSKGKAYDENWNEVDLLYGDGNKGTSGVNIGGQGGTEFCHMIFKNMALYMNKVFSKDDCFKAYNYLQTLKAK